MLVHFGRDGICTWGFSSRELLDCLLDFFLAGWSRNICHMTVVYPEICLEKINERSPVGICLLRVRQYLLLGNYMRFLLLRCLSISWQPTIACSLFASEWCRMWPLWRVVNFSAFLLTYPCPITPIFMFFQCFFQFLHVFDF